MEGTQVSLRTPTSAVLSMYDQIFLIDHQFLGAMAMFWEPQQQ